MTMHDPETGEIVGSPSLDIEMSATIGDLMGALAKAQAEIGNAEKSGFNPHFGKTYATLAAVFAASREALAKAGVAVVQTPFNLDNGDVGVATILGHSSGQWMKGRLFCKPLKYDAQALGSLITYLRRYSLSAMVGVAPADDDGNAAVGKPSDQSRPAAAPPRPEARTARSEPQGDDAPEDDVARAQRLYNSLTKEVMEALDSQMLTDISVERASDIEFVKKISPSGYDKLLKRVGSQKDKMANGGKASGEPKL